MPHLGKLFQTMYQVTWKTPNFVGKVPVAGPGCCASSPAV